MRVQYICDNDCGKVSEPVLVHSVVAYGPKIPPGWHKRQAVLIGGPDQPERLDGHLVVCSKACASAIDAKQSARGEFRWQDATDIA